MLKKVFISASAVLIAGMFCLSHSQEHEAVIKLDSPEDIEKFQKIFDGETKKPSGEPEKDLADNTKEAPPTAEIIGTEFEVYKPQAKDEAVFPEKSADKTFPKEIESAESEFKIYKPQVKEEDADNVKPKTKAVRNLSEDEFKVFIPQAKEDIEASDKPESNVKWLETDEDIQELNEILKKAHRQGSPAK
jgi:hypothetical protein